MISSIEGELLVAIYTPHGLKIRVPSSYAFALMARFGSRPDSLRVLELTEEVDSMASVASLVAGIVAFAARLEPMSIALVAGITRFGFWMAHLFGLFLPPFTFVLPLAQFYHQIPANWLCWPAILVLGFFLTGWQGVLAYIGGLAISAAASSGVGMVHGRAMYNQSGSIVTASERSFFHAYRLLADRAAITRSLEASDEELEPENWQTVCAEYASRWPEAASMTLHD